MFSSSFKAGEEEKKEEGEEEQEQEEQEQKQEQKQEQEVKKQKKSGCLLIFEFIPHFSPITHMFETTWHLPPTDHAYT